MTKAGIRLIKDQGATRVVSSTVYIDSSVMKQQKSNYDYYKQSQIMNPHAMKSGGVGAGDSNKNQHTSKAGISSELTVSKSTRELKKNITINK